MAPEVGIPLYICDTDTSLHILLPSQKQKINNILFFMTSIGICTTRIWYLAAALFLVLTTTFSPGQAGGCIGTAILLCIIRSIFGSKNYLLWPTKVRFEWHILLHACRLPWPTQSTKRDMWDGFATLQKFRVQNSLRNKGLQDWRCPLCWQGLLLRAKRMISL